MSDQTPEQRTALKLNTSPDQIALARDEFYRTANGAMVLALFGERIAMASEEHQRKLLTVTPDELRKEQGIIQGLANAQAALNRKL